VPTPWFLGLAAVLVVASLATRDLAGPMVLGGLYLVLTAGWALVRRRAAWRTLGARGLAGTVAVGAVVLLAGGAVAGPAARLPGAAEPLPGPSATPSRPGPTATSPGPSEPAPSPPTSAPSPAAPSASAPGPAATERASSEPAATEPAGADGTALATALELEVKGRAPRTGYDRDLFGSGWVDTDRNGCDTRNDILARDLTDLTYRPGTRECVVESGTLADPYSGATIHFVRGNATSNAVQIDHVVALSDAWQKGAQQWDEATRVRFGNDPLNLLAVDGPLNMQKGDGDTATWLPPDRAYRCAYVARQVAVKDAYGLWVTQAEQDAMVRVLGACPEEPLPAR